MLEFELLTLKDIMNLCNCSKHIAMKLRSDISEHFGIPKKLITYKHLVIYLRLNQFKKVCKGLFFNSDLNFVHTFALNKKINV